MASRLLMLATGPLSAAMGPSSGQPTADRTPQSSGTTDGLFGVYFTDANNGTVVGNSGLILRTSDGGQNWTPQTSGTTNQLRAVSFTDANTGTVVGDQGTILRTTDGGQSWVSQASGVSDVLLGVSFTDANTGTAVGVLGVILRTTDGGQNWIREASGTNQDLYGVSFAEANTGTAVGGYGAILRTTEPEPLEITLSANAYKLRGNYYVDVTWTGATSDQMDIYRNGTLIVTTENTGNYTDALGKQRKGTILVYKACQAGTQVCSNEATVEIRAQ